MISYDLNNEDDELGGPSYEDLYEALRYLGKCYPCTESTWIVDTEVSLQGVSKVVEQNIDGDDEVMIADITCSDVTGRLSKNAEKWIRARKESYRSF